ncbi:MAG: acyl-CoA dehydrogenase [Candidatus Abyssobacteria bacterium SURF_17]|uniref:Cyclohexane-1-carbonyl-CoA dehydrogenase n=1 Tax=Candidatus Abyssobacteria bacterium SURF_17 TaxID=2093361 RepID=A0A419EV51_9BACT|nr:MAG: acyl-CoA dehydrogenase [Candidatus Abyssubacteria bacterium SURF_17]
MDFELTEEQRMIQDMARNFAEKEVAPVAAELDDTHRFPTELAQKMGELGLMGVAVPDQYGGAGMDCVSYVVALEEISRACANTGVIMSVNNSLVCDPILSNGTEEQKKKFLTPLASGKKIGCFGLTEPNAGSDASNQKTTAVLDGDKWVINGSKIFITNASHADTVVLFATTDKEKGSRGISTFIVEKETPGYKVGKIERKLGLNASGTAELIFEDCRIPKDQLLGGLGQGFKIAMQTLDGGRIGIGAQAVGIARAAMEQSVKYSMERVQFNQPIAKFQAIQWMLADMATEIDASRLLVYRAARMKDAGQRYSKESAMAKLFASETAMKTATKAVQIHGGYGYSKEYPVERNFRDAKVTEIYEGTSEIQRLVIAANVLK